MTTAHTAPLDLTPLDDDALAALLVDVADDADELARVLAELDRRDDAGDDATAPEAPAAAPEEITPQDYRRAFLQQYREPGESIVDAASRYYGDLTQERYERAEHDCRGTLLNRAGEQRDSGVASAYELFHGNARRAYRWASDELLAWWAEHGRITWAEHMYEWTGYARYAGDAAKARGAWHSVLVAGVGRAPNPGAAPTTRRPRTKIDKFGAR